VSRFDRVPVEQAIAWIDGAARCLESEEVELHQASGRVLGADVVAPAPIPPVDCAAIDGLAVHAADSLGAGAYNPLTLPATAVMAGEALPDAMDAVVPFDLADLDDAGRVILVEPVTRGINVDRLGSVAIAGALLAAAGTRLAPRHLGLIAAAGIARVPLVRRPRVRLAIDSAGRPAESANRIRPMLCAAIERDGGVILESPLAEALAAVDADIVLVVDGAGPGRDQASASASAAASTLDIYGVALVPGEATGFGHTAAGAPMLLLPGPPTACLWSYELFSVRAIRRLGGRNPALPYRIRTMPTARKIVSSIGTTEICPVRLRPDGEVEPVASFAEIGLMAAAQADGFVVVPATSEGYPRGAPVTAHLYDES
jgi:molybdopterin molybdotransferase